MRLSDIKGEKALDVVADLIEPVAEIMCDKEISEIRKQEGGRIKAISLAIKNHKSAVMSILAALNGQTVEEYAKECNVLSLPKQLLDIINDPAMFDLFTSQNQETSTPSGSAMENIKAEKK